MNIGIGPENRPMHYFRDVPTSDVLMAPPYWVFRTAFSAYYIEHSSCMFSLPSQV